MKDVTIVIPCYNQGHFLEDAIRSVLDQTEKVREIIVVDDGSTDNTTQVARKYNVTYIYQDNKHLSAARNTGFKNAKTRWVIPLDADDKLHPEFVEKVFQTQEQYSAHIVSTWLQTFGNENRCWGSVDIEPTYQNFRQKNHINCCSLVDKKVWFDLCGYDEKMKEGFEDWDFWRRATRNGYKIRIRPEYLFFYRKHGVSMFKEAQKKRDKLIEYMTIKESKTGELIDVVYPLANVSRFSNNELKFSLRSLEKHVTGYRDIWVIGNNPSWNNGKIKHIQAFDKGMKAINILEKIRLACLCPEISDTFLYINDDHIFLRDCDACTYPFYYSDDDLKDILNNRPLNDPYRRIVIDTLNLYPELKYFDIHKPIRIEKAKFLEVYEKVNFKKYGSGLLIKSVYCNYHGIKGVKERDMILRTRLDSLVLDVIKMKCDVFSFHEEAVCDDLIRFLDKNYPIKSIYEK